MPRLSAPMTNTHLVDNSNQPPPTNSSSLSLEPFINLILILAIGVTPLLFSPAFSELFEFPKMVFIYALSLVGLLLITAKLLNRHQLNIPRTPLDRILGLYFLVFLAATAFSVDLYTSIVGYYTRFTGGLTSLVAYIILFYLTLIHVSESTEVRNQKSEIRNKLEAPNQKYLIFRFSNLFRISHPRNTQEGNEKANPEAKLRTFDSRILEQKVKPLFAAWLFSATLVSIYAILEHFGHDPSCLILRGSFTADCWIQDVSARAFATFGQPNWLACYLLTALPIALAQLLSTKSRWLGWLSSSSIILIYAAWWFTYSRAGWFGLASAIVILAFCLPLRLILDKKWWLLGIATCCLVITATSFNLAASRVGTSLESGADDSSTGQIRLLVWQGATNLIAHHPLLGTGPETFAYSFLPYRPRAMNDTTEWDFLYNKAHNEVLQTAATTGLLGLVTWLGIFVTIGIYLWRQGVFLNVYKLKTRNSNIKTQNRREVPNQKRLGYRMLSSFRISTSRLRVSDDTPSALNDSYIFTQSALFAGLSGVFIAQLLGFAVVITSLYFWLAVAIIIAPSVRFSTIPLPTLGVKSKAGSSPLFALIVLSVMVCIFGAGYVLLHYTQAEMVATTAQGQDAATAIIDDQQAVNLNPLEPTYHKDLALAYATFATMGQGANIQFLTAADQQAQTAYHLNPHDQIITKQLGYMYQQLALVKRAYQNNALHMDKAAWDLAPTDASAAETLADLQLEYGQKDAALQTYNQLIRLRPAPESYLHRAQWYKTYGTSDKYRAELQHVLKMDPQNKDAQSALDLLQTKTLPGDE